MKPTLGNFRLTYSMLRWLQADALRFADEEARSCEFSLLRYHNHLA